MQREATRCSSGFHPSRTSELTGKIRSCRFVCHKSIGKGLYVAGLGYEPALSCPVQSDPPQNVSIGNDAQCNE
ncbi:hypothetical protein V6N11_022722 [Hibiscus sabdariffa]|uniref:Uncharacterized protein n=1 Tax=Hibiscus sabdariffa TaxID=183260 RepID=A0ABR2TKT3_9ROSI